MHLLLSKWFPLFILASSVCWSLQCLISALTQGGGGGHSLRLTCSVVLWGGGNTPHKYHRRLRGTLAVSQPHWVCPGSWRVCFHGLRSSEFRLQVALPGTVLRRPWVACTSPGKCLSRSGSGSRVLPKGADSVGPAFCALPRSEQLR